jgi:hypothetical protein
MNGAGWPWQNPAPNAPHQTAIAAVNRRFVIVALAAGALPDFSASLAHCKSPHAARAFLAVQSEWRQNL